MELFTIKNGYMGDDLFECILPEYLKGKQCSLRLGEAVKIAIKEGANLRRAHLEWADLAGADLAGANLRRANLAGANLEGVNLVGVNLEGVNLVGANLAGANLVGVEFEGANLEGAKLDYNIQQGLLEQIAEIVIENPNKLEMSSWHTCETTHCLAGWACHLNNTAKELEKTHGTQIAGLLTLGAEAHSYFFKSDEEVLEWLKTK